MADTERPDEEMPAAGGAENPNEKKPAENGAGAKNEATVIEIRRNPQRAARRTKAPT